MSALALERAIAAEALRRQQDIQALRTANATVAVAALPPELLASRRLVHTAHEMWAGTSMAGAKDVLAAYTAAMWAGGSAAFGADGSAQAAFWLDPADWIVTGKVLRFITRLTVVTNATVPFLTFNGFLHNPGASGGATGGHLTLAAGSDMTGSTASVAASSAGKLAPGQSGAFACGTAGYYAPKVAVGATLPANSVVAVRWQLYAHNQ